ncbi:sigma-70 family RNA polymerase sigma factor [Nitratireductor sp. XY-223]|uniref:sigma-70 family RNA polymerase sigma factor n=1 Tax=Nitratireductor sp. XY-223 TaxID=2561926 RepID=UPI0010AAA92B|nr:sigma-70 family RNA polymerase sigma factor [Nitratireductor sp. XY-223]
MEEPTEDPGQKTDQAQFEALISAVAVQRDKSAFETLFVRFGPRIKGMMLGSGASQDLAEDLMQEVMLTVWRKAALYAPERGTVSTWIFTIARNARIDRLRRQPVQPYVDVETVSIASDAPSAEAEMITGQRGELVREALQRLPKEQRDVIELAFNQYMPQSEIARKLDLPIGTVKSRTRLAYKKLKENLEDLR